MISSSDWDGPIVIKASSMISDFEPNLSIPEIEKQKKLGYIEPVTYTRKS